ncbi:MAG: hypothetical protein MHM6MM_004946 [Cercozoa sp. M6MM]
MSEAQDPTQMALQYRWTLYHAPPKDKKSRQAANWSSNHKKVSDMVNVAEFWSLFNHLVVPSKMRVGSSFFLFKGEVQPEWEDAFNEEGGVWSVSLSKLSPEKVDQAWLDCVLALIGDQFEHASDIAGVILAVRRGKTRLDLWTRHASNEEVCKSIGNELKAFLKIDSSLQYKAHSTEMNKDLTSGRGYLYETD